MIAPSIPAETVREALRWARSILPGSTSPSLDAQLLLAHTLGTTRVWLLAHPDHRLSHDQLARFRTYVEQRSQGVPVAYLRGSVEWYGSDWEVSPEVLVPRPETELLVERAARIIQLRGYHRAADIGTGSGAIAIQLARMISELRVFAADVSDEALQIARRNATKHGVADRVELIRGDLLKPLSDIPEFVVANLPYLSEERMRTISTDVRHEPNIALLGGRTGTEIYQRLFEQMQERSWQIPALLEIDPEQPPLLESVARSIWPLARLEIMKDLAGIDRIALVEP